MGQIFNKLNLPMSLQSTGSNEGDLEYNDGIGVAQSSEDSTKQEVYHEEFSKGSSYSNTKLAAFNINEWGHITYINKDFSYAELPSVTMIDNGKKLWVRTNEQGKKEWIASKLPSGVKRLPYIVSNDNQIVTGFCADKDYMTEDSSYIFYDKNQDIITLNRTGSKRDYYNSLFKAEWVLETQNHSNNPKYICFLGGGMRYTFQDDSQKIIPRIQKQWGIQSYTGTWPGYTNGKDSSDYIINYYNTNPTNPEWKDSIWDYLINTIMNKQTWDFYIPFQRELENVDQQYFDQKYSPFNYYLSGFNWWTSIWNSGYLNTASACSKLRSSVWGTAGAVRTTIYDFICCTEF